jgi:glycosyltransferase involved in cell wall biosynthesis
VLTRDRDIGDDHSYDRPLDRWLDDGSAQVFYASPASLAASALSRALAEARPDVVLTNSVFSRLAIRVLVLRRLGRVPRWPVLLGPEGEFHEGALAQRGGRKRAYLRAAGAAGLWRGVTWRATSADEAADIRRLIGPDAPIAVAPVIPPAVAPAAPVTIEKQPGSAALVYLSRVTPKKNLLFLLECLHRAALPVSLDIVGPVDDGEYWARCQAAMARMTPAVQVRYLGEARPDAVPGHFARAHASVLPTLGENFGFAVLESMMAGRPVLVSTETPWRGLVQRQAGWDVPLDDTDGWVRALTTLVDMDAGDYAAWVAGARAMADRHQQDDDAPARLEQALRETAAGPVHG